MTNYVYAYDNSIPAVRSAAGRINEQLEKLRAQVEALIAEASDYGLQCDVELSVNGHQLVTAPAWESSDWESSSADC